MKKKVIGALAALAALLVSGCGVPALVEFSPDGKSIAYATPKALMLRQAGKDRLIDNLSPDEVVWSSDGHKLAWTTSDVRGKTQKPKAPPVSSEVKILNLATGRIVKIAGVKSPICWLGPDLVANRRLEKTEELDVIDACSGTVRYHVEAPKHINFLASTSDPMSILAIAGGPGEIDRFDGTNLQQITKTDDLCLPIKVSNDATIFCRSDSAKPQAPVRIARLEGTKLVPIRTVGAPGLKDGVKGVVEAWSPIAATRDLSQLAILVRSERGTPQQERLFAPYAKRYGYVIPGDPNDKVLQALLNKMHGEITLILRSHDRPGRVLARTPLEGPLIPIANFDPSGKTIAVLSDGKLRTFPVN